MKITKDTIRKTILSYRRMLPEDIYTERNQKMIEQVGIFLKSNALNTVHLFLPIRKNREPDLTPLLPFFHRKSIKVIASKTVVKDKSLAHFFIAEKTELIKGSYGIPEPSTTADSASLKDLDVIFVPLLVADKNGDRIGYGGGYYDRLLTETNAIRVGLSLGNPVDRLILTDEWDEAVDYLITPNIIYDYGKNRTTRK